MTNKQQTYYDDILESLLQLGSVCKQLKQDNDQLRQEVEQLRAEKNTIQDQQPSLPLDDNYRTALKHQLASHLNRLDQILKNP